MDLLEAASAKFLGPFEFRSFEFGVALKWQDAAAASISPSAPACNAAISACDAAGQWQRALLGLPSRGSCERMPKSWSTLVHRLGVSELTRQTAAGPVVGVFSEASLHSVAHSFPMACLQPQEVRAETQASYIASFECSLPEVSDAARA